MVIIYIDYEDKNMAKCKLCKTPLNSTLISDRITKYQCDKNSSIKCNFCGRLYRIDMKFHLVLSLFLSILTGYIVYTGIGLISKSLADTHIYIPSFLGSSLLFYLLAINGSIIAFLDEEKLP